MSSNTSAIKTKSEPYPEPKITDQLKDVVITIAFCGGEEADNTPYAMTRIFRYDLEGPIDEFIKYIEKFPKILEGSVLVNR